MIFEKFNPLVNYCPAPFYLYELYISEGKIIKQNH